MFAIVSCLVSVVVLSVAAFAIAIYADSHMPPEAAGSPSTSQCAAGKTNCFEPVQSAAVSQK